MTRNLAEIVENDLGANFEKIKENKSGRGSHHFGIIIMAI